jgi:hypothetical protein
MVRSTNIYSAGSARNETVSGLRRCAILRFIFERNSEVLTICREKTRQPEETERL